MQRFLLILEVC